MKVLNGRFIGRTLLLCFLSVRFVGSFCAIAFLDEPISTSTTRCGAIQPFDPRVLVEAVSPWGCLSGAAGAWSHQPFNISYTPTKPILLNDAIGKYWMHANAGWRTLAWEWEGKTPQDRAPGSIFLTSGNGDGYQAELKKGQKVSGVKVSWSPADKIQWTPVECQRPFGNPIACSGGCGNLSGDAKTMWNKPGTQGICDNPIFISNSGPDEGGGDFLNEDKTYRWSMGKAPADFVYLDTVINNSPTMYKVLTTTAPLVDTVDADYYSSNENTLLGAIKNKTFSVGSLRKGKIRLGTQEFVVNDLYDISVNPDGRFTFADRNSVNMARALLNKKYHMASPLLAISTEPRLEEKAEPFILTYHGVGNYGDCQNWCGARRLGANRTEGDTCFCGGEKDKEIQTIILMPLKGLSDCSPVILIGRDLSNNFYAYAFSIKSCNATDSKQDAFQGAVQAATSIVPGSKGRLRLVVSDQRKDAQGNVVKLNFGVPAELEVLEGNWIVSKKSDGTIDDFPGNIKDLKLNDEPIFKSGFDFNKRPLDGSPTVAYWKSLGLNY